MAEVATFGAIAVAVFSLVVLRFHGTVKPVFRFFDLVTDFGQISQLKRRAVFIDQVFKRNAVKTQISIVQVKSILWEVICLLNEVKITVLHSPGKATGEM